MDISTVHGLWTLVLLIVFVGIVLWAYSRKRKRAFDAAARIPLDDEDAPSSWRGGRCDG